MSWLDIPLIIFLAIIIMGGVQRGFIAELFDILILTLGTCLAFLMFSYIGGIIKGITGYESKGLDTFLWFLIFGVTGMVLFVVGIRVDEKLMVSFPKKWWKILGGTLAAVKGFLILFIILVFIGNTVTRKEQIPLFRNSALVSTIQGAEPLFETVVVSISSDKYKDSLQKYMRNSVYLDKK